MAFEEIKQEMDDVQIESKAYLDSSFEYYKLWGFKVAMKSAVTIAKVVVIGLFLLMMILFLSIAAAIAIGEWLDSLLYGFLCVAGIYLLLTLFVVFISDKVVTKPLLEKFSEIFFND